jgi:hypothetical protein
MLLRTYYDCALICLLDTIAGKHVEPIKLSCGKLRRLMECIDVLIDELFRDAPKVDGNEAEAVSNEDLPAFMKTLFKEYKACIDTMNYEGRCLL